MCTNVESTFHLIYMNIEVYSQALCRGPASMPNWVSSFTGRDLGGTGGAVPQKIWGGRAGPCIRPPIFGEVVLLEACESSKRKKGVNEELFWLNRHCSLRKESDICFIYIYIYLFIDWRLGQLHELYGFLPTPLQRSWQPWLTLPPLKLNTCA